MSHWPDHYWERSPAYRRGFRAGLFHAQRQRKNAMQRTWDAGDLDLLAQEVCAPFNPVMCLGNKKKRRKK